MPKIALSKGLSFQLDARAINKNHSNIVDARMKKLPSILRFFDPKSAYFKRHVDPATTALIAPMESFDLSADSIETGRALLKQPVGSVVMERARGRPLLKGGLGLSVLAIVAWLAL